MRWKFWQDRSEPVQAISTVDRLPLGELDLRALWRALVARKAWIIIPTVVAAGLAFATVNLITPRYKSEARILIDGRENVFLRPSGDRVEERSAPDPEAVTSQVQLVLSRDLAREIIRKNKLADRPEFDPVLRGISPLRALLAMIGVVRDPLKMTPEERVLNAYYDRLAAYAVDKSRVIVVEFQSRDPELAAAVANSIAEGYLVLQQQAKREQARSASQWLSGEIDNLRKKVSDAESRVEDFRSKASLFVGTNNTTLSNQQMGEINTQLNNARAQKSDAEVKARMIRDMLQSGKPIEVSEILNSELLRRLNEQRVTLRAQLAEQSSTLLDGHPRIKELKAQINDLDRQIREEAARTARSFENDARIAGARVESLSGGLDQLKRQAGSSNEQDVQLRALEREARAQRDLLESYLARYREAVTRETIDAGPSDGRIISRAIVSNTPAYPKKFPIVVIATLAALMLTSGLVLTGELLKLAGPAANGGVENGYLARSGPATGLRFHEPRFSPAGTPPNPELERLATRLAADGARARKIAVLGANTACATSVAALALAREMAKNATVVLVGLSPEATALANVAIDPASPGLSDLAAGQASFGQIITRDRMSRVQIIGAGQAKREAAMLQSPRLALALDALTQVYDHVILDAGPLEMLPQPLAASHAQAVLVIPAGLESAQRDALEGEVVKAGFNAVTMLPDPADGAATETLAA